MTLAGPSRGLRLLQRPRRVEAALWRRHVHQSDAAARGALVQHYHSLACRIAASEYRRRPAYGLERADFEQLAVQGLIEAIDRFDPGRSVPFEAFARYRIRGAISNGLSGSSEGAALYRYRRRLELERIEVLKAAGTAETDDPLAALTRYVTDLAIGFMLDEAAEIDAEAGMADAWQSVAWRDLLHSLKAAVGRLLEPEQGVILRHYFQGESFADIAAAIRLSRGRVSQIHKAALDRLRHHIEPPD